jgi:hypothetical protein
MAGVCRRGCREAPRMLFDLYSVFQKAASIYVASPSKRKVNFTHHDVSLPM